MIFSTLPSNTLGDETFPRTLTTIFSRFNLKDQFTEYPVCYLCHRIFEQSVGPDTLCPDCECRIFRPKPRSLFQRLFQSESEPVIVIDSDEDMVGVPEEGQPYVVAPLQPLSDALQHLFERPGNVSAVNAWKSRRQVPGELKCMQDAEVWKTIKGPDNKSFFFGGDCDKEIRLGVTFSLDW
jgi:DNA-directed RNA polymerase subunit RPC12/RpoP